MSLVDVMSGTVGHPRLAELLDKLPQAATDTHFGDDIDAAHTVLLDPAAELTQKRRALDLWLSRSQPCLFGRLAARQHGSIGASKGLGYDLVWIDEEELTVNQDRAASKIQIARRRWKDRAETGDTSALLVIFAGMRLARATPGAQFAELCRRLAALYLMEFGQIGTDVVYTEAVPLRSAAGELALYKASTQLFYTGAHLMRNHDRRFPGGIAIVVNGPGHLARSLVRRGLGGEESAVGFVRETAYRSVGNGGIGHPGRLSSSWHHSAGNRDPHQDLHRFAATYQVDVLLQSDVVTDRRPRLARHEARDVWPDLHLEYISRKPTPLDDPDFGWYNGLPIDDAAKYHNPWTPRRAENSPDFNY